MRFLALNDLHISDRAPESRTDNYIDELMDLLWQVHEICRTDNGDPGTKVTALLIPGDIFHRKTGIAMGVFRRVVEWCQAVRSLDVDIVTVPGNHDLAHDRYESLPNQPLGVLYALGLMQDVSVGRGKDAASWMFRAGNSTVTVKAVGIPFPDACDINAWRALPARGKREVIIALGHCFASPEGGDMFGETFLSYRTLAQQVDADVFIFGHEHTDRGIVTEGAKTFINMGALSRGSIGQDDITRPIVVASLWVEWGGVSARPLPLVYRPAHELFDLERKAARDAEHAAVAAFVASLRDDIAALDRGDSLDTHLAALNLPQQVRDAVLRYIEDVEQTT